MCQTRVYMAEPRRTKTGGTDQVAKVHGRDEVANWPVIHMVNVLMSRCIDSA